MFFLFLQNMTTYTILNYMFCEAQQETTATNNSLQAR